MISFEDVALHTSRLRLRPLRRTDAPALFGIFSDSRVTRYLSRPPWSTIEQALERVAEDEVALPAKRYIRLGIERADSEELIGECSLFNLAEESKRAEIGYVLANHAWRRGYMGEALASLLELGFEELGLNRVEADIDPDNLASARTLERLGFQQEGRLRERWIVAGEVTDSYIYGLLRRDWEHQHRAPT